MYTGPKVENEDLEFGHDTGRGVLSNHVSSRFYAGEPTVNYATDSPTGGGWGGGHDVIDSANKTFKFKVQSFSSNPGAGWRSFTWDMTSHAGSVVTISATFEYAGPVGQMAFVYIGQGNTYTNNQGAGAYLGYSPTSDRTSKTTETKERISWSGTIGSGGSANQPNGHIGLTVWINNGVPVGNGNYDSYIVMSNIQIEKKAHATPFVNGTRSDTQGLIDLKRTASVDLSDVSFGSSGLVEFDGTDDYINLGDYAPIKLGTNFTIECVVRPEQDKWMYHFWKGYGSNNSLALGRHSSNDKWMLASMIGGSYVYLYTGTATLNEYCHLVYTYDGSNVRVYQNGVLEATSAQTHDMLTSNASAGIGGPNRYWNGKIPVTKIYSKVLTTEEVVSNFKAYKNRFNI